MGNARLNLQKVGTTLNIEARDDVDQNLDFTISAQGTGKIRLGSVLAISDLNFIIPNSIDETKIARFSTANLTAGLTNVYTFPSILILEGVVLDNVASPPFDELLNENTKSLSCKEPEPTPIHTIIKAFNARFTLFFNGFYRFCSCK